MPDDAEEEKPDDSIAEMWESYASVVLSHEKVYSEHYRLSCAAFYGGIIGVIGMLAGPLEKQEIDLFAKRFSDILAEIAEFKEKVLDRHKQADKPPPDM